jgi:hypothetical protein
MSYPSTIRQFVTKIDKNASGYFVGPEYFNVPSASPYQLYLDHVPKESATTIIGASGAGDWLQVFAGTPLANQYLVDYDYGKVTFAAANAGNAARATYYNLGDDIMAEHVNSLQSEVILIEEVLGVGIDGGYGTVDNRLHVHEAIIFASGIDGTRITDNTVRAGALRDDIKGVGWEIVGRPTLYSNFNDILTHENASPDAHSAQAIAMSAPFGTTGITVQDHIDSSGVGSISNRNPHGTSISDITEGILDGNIGARNVLPVSTLAVFASGMYEVGSIIYPWASGSFDTVQARSFKTGESLGVTGTFTAGANIIQVLNGLIVNIL